MQPSQQSKYQQRRHFLAQRHPGEPNLEDVVPGRGAYISSRAQFRSEARMFEHGMIYRRPARGRPINLLRLARSSAAGQGVLVLLDGFDSLHRLEPLEHGVAVQVIDLVLQAHAE